MKEILVLLGPPASGKGTQSELISKNLSYLPISTGDLLRKEIDKGGELGKEIAAAIDKGNLVPDDLMFDILLKKIRNTDSKGFIFDGFPRTLEQAKMLSDFLEKSDEFVLKKVIVIELDKETIIDRIANRITCGNCGAVYNSSTKKPKVSGECDICHSKNLIDRKDDLDIVAINRRIDIFRANVSDIVSFYEKKSLIFLINGLKDVNAVNLEIMEALSN